MEELPLDHQPSLNHWAKCIADDDVATVITQIGIMRMRSMARAGC